MKNGLLAVAFLAVLSAVCPAGGGDRSAVQKARQEKDREFKTSPTSPLAGAERRTCSAGTVAWLGGPAVIATGDNAVAFAGGNEDRSVGMGVEAAIFRRFSKQDVAGSERERRSRADKTGRDNGVAGRNRRYGGGQRRIIGHDSSCGKDFMAGVIIHPAASAYHS